MPAASKLPIVDTKGQVVREVDLPAAVLGRRVKPVVVHQVVVGYAANRRAGTAHTKNRAEVSGGGKKPWKQKGTGRARHGSIRSPLWVGGGVTHGPRNTRQFRQRLPHELKQQALAMVVTDYLTSGRVTVVESFPEATKTKVFARLFQELKLNPERPCLVLLTEAERALRRGFKNLAGVEIMGVRQLNPYDGLRLPRWLMSAAGLAELVKVFT